MGRPKVIDSPYDEIGLRNLEDFLLKNYGLRVKPDELLTLLKFIKERAKLRGIPVGPDTVDNLLKIPEERRRFVSLITNKESSFFREPAQFKALSDLIFPELLKKRQPLFIWSAGCSTGEEPYTIAIVAKETNTPVRILGTDVDELALERARVGVYRSWALRNLPTHIRNKYFVQVSEDEFQISPEIRQMVNFKHHNLISQFIPHPEIKFGWDIIFCRNVLIYFHTEIAIDVFRRLHSALDKDGYLFLSSTELFFGQLAGIPSERLNNIFVFRRAK